LRFRIPHPLLCPPPPKGRGRIWGGIPTYILPLLRIKEVSTYIPPPEDFGSTSLLNPPPPFGRGRI